MMLKMLKNFLVRFREKTPGYGSEHEQALARIIISFLVAVYLSYRFFSADNPATIKQVFIFSVVWNINSILLGIGIFRSRKPSETRQFLAMVADICAITYGMCVSGEIGSLFFGIYLWVTVGNGLRYGSKSLIRAQVLSIIGFLTVIALNDYWSTNSTLAGGLLLTLIAIPLLTFFLLRRLSQAIMFAEEASKAKSQFLSNMSHEMRTPLNGVIGASDLILQTTLNSEQQDLVHTLRNSAHILFKLIEDVLDLSKIESGKLIAELVDFDLHSMINKTMDMFTSQVEKKGVRLQIHIAPETCFLLHGNAQHLRQILINLIGNAVKFTPTGSVELLVTTLDQDEKSTRLRFEVIDTGIGIPQESQQAIFESFTQAHSSITRTYGGTGLGTTISKQLVEFMGGEIGLHSKENMGSTFWFELPFEKQQKSPTLDDIATLSHIRVLGAGMLDIEQTSVTGHLSGWGTRFDHAASVAHFFSLLGQILTNSQQKLIVLCRPKAFGINPKDFATHVWADYSPSKVSLILIAPDLDGNNEEALLKMGYSCLLRTPIDKALLFNALHGEVSTRAATSGEAVSFREHYERNSLAKLRLNILVAEDNGTNRKILSKILEYAGHNVDLVENGEQALDLLEINQYDLAIMDMQMPVMGGLEALRIYRMIDSMESHMPIAILTASATIEAKRECEEAGVDAFLTKPIDSYTLLDTVARLSRNNSKGSAISEPASNRPTPIFTANGRLLDRNTLHQLKLLGEGNENFVDTVIQGFVLEGEQLLEAMNAAILSQDYESFKELAHSMKGSAGNMGAEALFQICREIMLSNHADLKSSADNLLRKAQASFSATRQAMNHYLLTL